MTSETRPGGGPPVALAAVAVVGLVLMFVAIGATLVGGGAGAAGGDSAPTAATPATPATSGEAARQTGRLAIRTLGALGIQVAEPQTPYRPAESPTLYAAPRLALQAVLPDDPTGGHFLVYELPTTAAAQAAGTEFARYLASGVGRIQFPTGARFLLQQVGTTLVFFTWSPESAPDPRTAELAAGIATLGQPIPVAP